MPDADAKARAERDAVVLAALYPALGLAVLAGNTAVVQRINEALRLLAPEEGGEDEPSVR